MQLRFLKSARKNKETLEVKTERKENEMFDRDLKRSQILKSVKQNEKTFIVTKRKFQIQIICQKEKSKTGFEEKHEQKAVRNIYLRRQNVQH